MDKHNENEAIGTRLSHFRRARALTVAELSALSGVPSLAISEIEASSRTPTRWRAGDVKEIEDLARGLSIDAGLLWGDGGNVPVLTPFRRNVPQTPGARLRFYRERAGLTIREVSEATGVPTSTIASWEDDGTGARTHVSHYKASHIEAVSKLATAIGVEADKIWNQEAEEQAATGPTSAAGPIYVGELPCLESEFNASSGRVHHYFPESISFQQIATQTGHSMKDRVPDGATVAISTELGLGNDSLCVIQRGDVVALFAVRRGDDMRMRISTPSNPSDEIDVLESGAKCLGRVVGIQVERGRTTTIEFSPLGVSAV